MLTRSRRRRPHGLHRPLGVLQPSPRTPLACSVGDPGMKSVENKSAMKSFFVVRTTDQPPAFGKSAARTARSTSRKTSSNGGSWLIWCARRAVQSRRKRSSFAAIACSMPATTRCRSANLASSSARISATRKSVETNRYQRSYKSRGSVARPVAQGQKLFNHDFLDVVDLHGWPVGQVVKAVVDAMNRSILQRKAQDFVDRDINLHVVRGG